MSYNCVRTFYREGSGTAFLDQEMHANWRL